MDYSYWADIRPVSLLTPRAPNFFSFFLSLQSKEKRETCPISAWRCCAPQTPLAHGLNANKNRKLLPVKPRKSVT